MPKLTKMTIGFMLAAMTAALSCAAFKPALVGQDALRNNAVEMKVSGRLNMKFKQSVVYGPFHTDTFSTGFAKVNHDKPERSPTSEDISTYTTATQGFHFTQYDSAGDTIGVRCLDTIKAKVTQYSNLTPDEVSNCHYEIHLSKNDGEKVFLMYTKGKPLAIPFGKDTVKMTDEYKSDVKEKMVFQGVLFAKSGETIAAVSLMSEGSVWIKNELDNESKLLIAAIATAMLVQPSLENISPQ